MGFALDSLVMAVEIAGSVAVLALILSLITRLRTEPKRRGLFGRLPFLLPAVTFVISLIIVGQLGILPMAEYKGTNYVSKLASSGERFSFNVYESNVVYFENVELTIEKHLMPGESIISTIDFLLLGSLIETVYVNLTSTGVEDSVTDRRLLDLDPGQYEVRIHHTIYEYGIPDYDVLNLWVEFTLLQSMKSSFLPEIVTWSSIQFGVGIACFFFILGGIAIGDASRPRNVDDRVSEEPQVDYGDGGPEYGKGC
jgi:hypothetical protein